MFRFVFILCLEFLLGNSALTQDRINSVEDILAQEKKEYFSFKQLKLQAHLDKLIYYSGESLSAEVFIRNESEEQEFNVLLSKNEMMYSFGVEVWKGEEQVAVLENEQFFLEKDRNLSLLKQNDAGQQKRFFNFFSIKPSQILGFKMNLDKMYSFEPGVYYINFVFYPLGIMSYQNRIQSNKIRIEVMEDGYRGSNSRFGIAGGENNFYSNLYNPGDVVKAYLTAKKERNWDLFFAVINLKEFIKAFPPFHKKYSDVGISQKKDVLNDFSVFLKDLGDVDRIIDFTVLREEIEKNKAIVTVEVKTLFGERSLKKEYRFKLSKKRNWYIDNYSVMLK